MNGKSFSETRVEGAIKKIKAVGKKGTQPRLEAFFGKPTIIKSTVGPKKEEKSVRKKVLKK